MPKGVESLDLYGSQDGLDPERKSLILLDKIL
jgi:hypothetical protein